MSCPNFPLEWNLFSVIQTSGPSSITNLPFTNLFLNYTCIWIPCFSSKTLLLEWTLIFPTFIPFSMNGAPFNLLSMSSYTHSSRYHLLFTSSIEASQSFHPHGYLLPWKCWSTSLFTIYLAYTLHGTTGVALNAFEWHVYICKKDIFGGAYFPQSYKALGAHKPPAKLINRWASESRASNAEWL